MELNKSIILSRSGFSFLEMMLALVIFSMIFGVVFQFMNTANSSWRDAEVGARLREQADYAVERIFDELRRAGRPESYIFSNLQPGSTQSGFQIPSDAAARADGRTYAIGFQYPEDPGTGGTVLDAAGQINYGDRVLYYLTTSGNLLRYQTDAAGNVTGSTVAARDVSFFEVAGDQSAGPNYVDVKVNVQQTSLSKRVVLFGEDPASGLRRGGGTRIALRNLASEAATSSTGSSSEVLYAQ